MRTAYLFIFSIGIAITPACNRSLSGGSGAKNTVELFNGQNLDNWVIYGTEKWYVENGEIVCEPGPDKGYGYLGTLGEFKNIDLSLEFIQDKVGDSGVFFRSSVEGTRVSGWQSEIDPIKHETGGIYESYGRGWLVKPDSAKVSRIYKEKDWNTMRLRAVDGQVTTWLNGKEIVNMKDDTIGMADKGQILLQIHEGEADIRMRWRNIRLREL